MYSRRLYDLYKTPIGLVATDWGGTCAEAWSSPDALAKCGLQPKRSVPPIKRPQDPINLKFKRFLKFYVMFVVMFVGKLRVILISLFVVVVI